MKSTRNIESKKEGYKKWSKSIEKDGTTKSVSVEQCENGFIICISEWGDKDGHWKDDNKKYISTTNPLGDVDIVDKDKEAKEEWKEAIAALGL